MWQDDLKRDCQLGGVADGIHVSERASLF